jgi:hypothetical protein
MSEKEQKDTTFFHGFRKMLLKDSHLRWTVIRTRWAYLLPPTLIQLSVVGATCFSSCCDKYSAFIFTTGRLPDVNPP